jgi:predicted GIY-YIG superfamily endonuclease
MAYLYLYEGADRRLYIGIGTEMTRPWEAHNEDAEALLREPTTQVLQTPEPFSSRHDARMAEAIAIHVAALAGLQIFSDREDVREIVAQATNRAGMKSTQHLVPAVLRKPGTVDYSTLRQTAIVVLKPGDIDDRPSLHGGRDVATFVTRAEKYWPLKTARTAGYAPQRLLAIMKTSHVIAGDWDLDLETPVLDDRFLFADPGNDDPRGVKGMQLDMAGARLGNLVTWSGDIRAGLRP